MTNKNLNFYQYANYFEHEEENNFTFVSICKNSYQCKLSKIDSC